ncbi:hypothetical protein [Pseudoponticoccus marisrubri]|uniref:Dihydroorotate dehydrogenase n=1 Tax=Pseudoponticoccus marisrubri TaxID=1685382 RepID=A0A0W7WNL3_9RHOB|nr:hypothetical protein [Pseudoponticoccus marisrubri]KUF12171.1 hypothetical protein AVJ23_00075 [Pseudoponticoccus marisrubri]
MTERKDETGLEAFFAAARETDPQPSGDFMARLEAEALAERPRPATGGPLALWRQLRAAIGGWPGVAGLATACAAGIWLGVSPPEGLSTVWPLQEAAIDTLGVDPLSGFDLAMMEG